MAGKAPVRVLITGAAGQIGYPLTFAVARGDMLGYDQPVILHLLDIAPCMEALSGVVMEIEDCAFPLVRGIIATADVPEAFTDIDYALLVGSFPRKDGMERKDLLQRNAGIFVEQGKALDKFSKKTVKVVVVGNPANTNCAVAQHCAPSIPKENFSALTRLDHNRAKGQIAKSLHVDPDLIQKVAIWGNHSSTQFPDTFHATLNDKGAKHPVREALKNDSYLDGDFIKLIQQRGAAVIKARKASSAASASNAIINHMHDWIYGTPEGDWVSMAVFSDGSYGITPGLFYSYPVTIKDGKYSIVHGLNVNEFSRKKLDETAAELIEEKQQAFEFLKDLLK